MEWQTPCSWELQVKNYLFGLFNMFQSPDLLASPDLNNKGKKKHFKTIEYQEV